MRISVMITPHGRQNTDSAVSFKSRESRERAAFSLSIAAHASMKGRPPRARHDIIERYADQPDERDHPSLDEARFSATSAPKLISKTEFSQAMAGTR